MHPAVSDLMELLPIPGTSADEGKVAQAIEAKLRALGVPGDAIRYDRTFEQSEYGGSTGNMIVTLPRRGGHAGSPLMFMAHMDGVALTVGCKPRLAPAEGDQPARIVNDDPNTAVGADDRTGCALLLHVVRELLAGDRPHPPITLVFTVQEEVGLVGARGLRLDQLGPDRPVMGFNYDGGLPHRIIHAVTGTTRVFMEIYGKAAHTGINPWGGVSAAVVAARAMAELYANGWHGPIDKPEGRGSGNIGILQGGQMTNTVMDHLTVRGEVRSRDNAFRKKLADLYRDTFERMAADTKNNAGECACVEWSLGPCYDSFAIAEDAPVITAAKKAIAAHGLQGELEINDGGMDANWINAHGLPMVTLGTGQHGAHSVHEFVNVELFIKACDIAVTLATQPQ